MEIKLQSAKKAIELATERATDLGVAANIAIVDNYGYLKDFERMDNAFLGSIDVALQKAKTAMLFRMNSEEVGNFLAPEAAAYGLINTSGGLVGFKGGIPIKENNAIIGYIGVSGGSPDQDFEIAKAGSIL
uniref:Heme-binding protein n=1 Tax=Elizabethkingia anophelis TaxID=1117645 RepID=A0A455ZCT9_9FLAO|nr:heme-binding protein [Elizabethkingia anophelis]DAC74663.1 TPA_exp: hypothetical protein [Elizabethkingia anophelis]